MTRTASDTTAELITAWRKRRGLRGTAMNDQQTTGLDLRQAIRAESGMTTSAHGLVSAHDVLDAAVKVAGEAIAQAQAEAWRLELCIEKALERLDDGEDESSIVAALKGEHLR